MSDDLKTNIVIDLRGDLPAQTDRFRRHLRNFTESGSRRLAMMQRSVASVSNTIDTLGNRALLGGAGLAYAFKRTFLDTAAEFEKFQTVLETIEGSSAKAKTSMDWIQQFAATTPYQLEQVTDAFVKLRSYGMEPMHDHLLRTLGDTSAAMGKPVMQAVEAIADAVTGENERLKEFGIKANIAGNKIVYQYTSHGETMQKVANKNSRKQIQETLQAIWNEKYAGAMDKLSHTWIGMTSNMADQWTLFENQVMQKGLFDQLKGEIDGLLDKINQLKKSGQLDDIATQFSVDLIAGLRAAKEAGAGLWEVLKGVGDAASFLAKHTGGYRKLAEILAGVYLANKALRFGAGAFKGVRGLKNVITGGRKGTGRSANPLLDAASGMTPVPVYVVNSPGGLGEKIPGVSRTIFSKVKTAVALVGGTALADLSMLGASGMALAAGGVALAGAAGYGAGTGINWGINKADKAFSLHVGDTIGRAVTAALAFAGNDAAQATLARHDKAAKIEIEITGDGGKQARVRRIDTDGLGIEASGAVMQGY